MNTATLNFLTLSRTRFALGLWIANRTAARALERLDDRMLRDMGIQRCSIPRVVKGNLQRSHH